MQHDDSEVRQCKKAKLALAIARGESISAWARQNEVPERSAYRWAKDPKVTRAVEACRRRYLGQAIGRLAKLASKAADTIAKLAEGAQSEEVQLKAARAILADQMAVAKFSNLEQRIAELEEMASDRTGQPDFAA
jgi:hypothetical protein